MVNKYNLDDLVKIKKDGDEYKIVAMEFDTFNKPKKIWYKLYRLSDGYTCFVAETRIEKYERN